MEQTLRQLGELLLGAVPTAILLGTLYILYTFLVHRPLTAVLAERRSRTQGAMEKARADIAGAEARTRAQDQVKQARAFMEEDKREAMSKLQSEAARLATDIVRTVLRPMASPSQVGGQ